MSGIEMTAELNASGRKVPVILISAFPDEIIQAQADAAGARVFLRKPFDEDELADRLDQILAA